MRHKEEYLRLCVNYQFDPNANYYFFDNFYGQLIKPKRKCDFLLSCVTFLFLYNRIHNYLIHSCSTEFWCSLQPSLFQYYEIGITRIQSVLLLRQFHPVHFSALCCLLAQHFPIFSLECCVNIFFYSKYTDFSFQTLLPIFFHL